MRYFGVHHVEFSVLDYEESIRFYDRMFGWLGYQSFWTLDVSYRSTYYVARLPWLPMPWDILRSLRAARALWKEHPEWKRHPAREMWRRLPPRGRSRGPGSSDT